MDMNYLFTRTLIVDAISKEFHLFMIGTVKDDPAFCDKCKDWLSEGDTVAAVTSWKSDGTTQIPPSGRIGWEDDYLMITRS
jgi:hypothetical protein